MKINLRHLNQSHLLRQAQPICSAGTCSERDILNRLLLILDLYDINLDIVKCDSRSNYDLTNPVIWLLMIALGVVLSHAACSIGRRCKRLFCRHSPGKWSATKLQKRSGELWIHLLNDLYLQLVSSRPEIYSFVPARSSYTVLK